MTPTTTRRRLDQVAALLGTDGGDDDWRHKRPQELTDQQLLLLASESTGIEPGDLTEALIASLAGASANRADLPGALPTIRT